MAALCKAPTKSAGIGLSITAVCKNAGKKTLGQDDFFVVDLCIVKSLIFQFIYRMIINFIFFKNMDDYNYFYLLLRH